MDNLLEGRTRCLLVRPEFMDDTFYNMGEVCELLGAASPAPPLGLLTVAAQLPAHWQLRCIDEDIEPVRDADLAWADLVMLSCIGAQQVTARKLIERSHALGKKVVVGGSGPTLEPSLLPEADYVVRGEAEDTLPLLLEDLRQGRTSGRYASTHKADMRAAVTPRYDLARLDQYIMVGLAFGRGCPFSCEFCAQIEIFGRKTRTKSVEQVITELQTIYDLGYRGQVDFGFDNLIGDIPQAEAVLTAMAEWGEQHGWPFHYSTEATMNLGRLPKILALMQQNDFRMVFVGIESGDEDVLDKTQKGQNTGTKPSDAVRAINQHGMLVNTGIILGFDGENQDTAANIIGMLQRTGAFPTLILPLHALPSTQLERRMRAEGRLFANGRVAMNTTKRTDTATTGLNFVTARPRAQIQKDLVYVLTEAYDAGRSYQRIELTLSQLDQRPKYRPSLREVATYARSFLFRIVPGLGTRPQTRRHFWKLFLRTLVRKPSQIAPMVQLAVMQDNYVRQSASYIEALKTQIAFVEASGEATFNQEMLALDAAPKMLDTTLAAAS